MRTIQITVCFEMYGRPRYMYVHVQQYSVPTVAECLSVYCQLLCDCSEDGVKLPLCDCSEDGVKLPLCDCSEDGVKLPLCDCSEDGVKLPKYM